MTRSVGGNVVAQPTTLSALKEERVRFYWCAATPPVSGGELDNKLPSLEKEGCLRGRQSSQAGWSVGRNVGKL